MARKRKYGEDEPQPKHQEEMPPDNSGLSSGEQPASDLPVTFSTQTLAQIYNSLIAPTLVQQPLIDGISSYGIPFTRM